MAMGSRINMRLDDITATAIERLSAAAEMTPSELCRRAVKQWVAQVERDGEIRITVTGNQVATHGGVITNAGGASMTVDGSR